MKRKDRKNKAENEFTNELGVLPQLTLLGNREAMLEGCKELTEFENGKVKFNLGNLDICFCGNNLLIKNFGDGSAIISGEISDISFC